MVSVSAIIPAFNLEAFLEEAVQSLLAQTKIPDEILIVDNNSADQTLQVAKKLAGAHPTLIRVFEEQQQGAPYARNRGLQEAKGSWIQYLDGDDLLLPQKIEYQLRFIAADAGFVASPSTELLLNGKERFVPMKENVWNGLFAGGGSLGFTSSILWRRKALLDIGGWAVAMRRHQEYELMFRLLTAKNQGILAPEPFTIKRKRESGQISDIPYAEILFSSLKFRGRILKYALETPGFDKNSTRFFLEEFFRRYTRLRVRRKDYAIQIADEYLRPLLTPEIMRQYPELHWLRTKSDVYSFYKYVKARWGIRRRLQRNSGS